MIRNWLNWLFASDPLPSDSHDLNKLVQEQRKALIEQAEVIEMQARAVLDQHAALALRDAEIADLKARLPSQHTTRVHVRGKVS